MIVVLKKLPKNKREEKIKVTTISQLKMVKKDLLI